MSTRLAKGGRLLDRSKPLNFTFNGASSNYDGFGRDASDNDSVLAFLWTALCSPRIELTRASSARWRSSAFASWSPP